MALQLRVCIDVSDLEAGIAFYRDALGLSLGRRLGAKWADMLGASSPLDLLAEAAGTAPTSRTTSRDYGRHWTPVHLDCVVTDLDAAVQRAIAAGATLDQGIQPRKWGRIATLADPFGNGLCVLEFRGRGYDELLGESGWSQCQSVCRCQFSHLPREADQLQRCESSACAVWQLRPQPSRWRSEVRWTRTEGPVRSAHCAWLARAGRRGWTTSGVTSAKRWPASVRPPDFENPSPAVPAGGVPGKARPPRRARWRRPVPDAHGRTSTGRPRNGAGHAGADLPGGGRTARRSPAAIRR